MLDQSNISSAADQKTVTYDQFSALDIRVGTVVSAEIPEWSNKLLQFTVDFGPLGTKTIFSGVKKYYQPEDFIGKQFCFLYNLEPKKMGESFSEGMMMMVDPSHEEEVVGEEAAKPDEANKPVLLPLPSPVPNGSKVR